MTYRILTNSELFLRALDQAKKHIDIEHILKTKARGLYRILPGFAIRWLKRKLHEDDINNGLNELNKYHGLEFNENILKYLGVKVELTGKEHLNNNGGVIIAANHPLGGIDGMALIYAVGTLRPDVRFIVNDILRNLKNFGDIFVGVNKVGNSTRDSLQVIEQAYSSEAAVLIFPAGLVSRKLSDGIKDLDWNKSFISKAVKYNKSIIPVFIEGKNSSFFYNFAKWRKLLGIKANLEMLFLPDEMFRQKGKTIRIHFGTPIDPNTLDHTRSAQQWASEMRSYVYSGNIQKNIPFAKTLK